jgi:hypothetical protein
MKIKTAGLVLIVIVLISCDAKKEQNQQQPTALVSGTWRLIKGILIEKSDTTVTDYTKNVSFIKVINGSHFAFLQHDLEKGKGATPVYVSGGGSYSLKDSLYTEHLEYCSDRAWEGNDFSFVVEVKNDTLVQRGVEKVENAGVDRINIEKYVKVK